MGTYPTTPSHVLSSGEKLQDVIDASPEELVGKNVLAKYGTNLPFLPKILSIAKALPLQLHPNKDLAAKLNEQQPDKFTDSNHKPEIAIALSDFETFVGFKPLDVISGLFRLAPLKCFLPNDFDGDKIDDSTLRHICNQLLTAPPNVVKDVEVALQSIPKDSFGQEAYILDLLPRLQEQYSNTDNGTLVALLCMNYMKLGAGEAIYVPQDSIHAYLSGDIIECMARSDNVLSTGFCPQPDRDSVDTFMEALSFQPHDANAATLPATKSDKGSNRTLVYAPPAGEFNVLTTSLTDGQEEAIKEILGPSILIVTAGSGSMRVLSQSFELKEGYVFFIGQGAQMLLKANTGESLKVFRFYCE